MKRRDFNKNLAAATAVILSPLPCFRNASAATVGGAITVFSYPNGFAGASGAIHLCSDATLSGSIIRLIDSGGHEAAGAWYTTKQPPTAFSTQFTFRPSGLGNGSATQQPSGMTFCIQNTVSPPGAPGYVGMTYAGDANMCGYGGSVSQTPPRDSVMVKFDAGAGDSSGLNSFRPGGQPSSTGLYFNGGPSVTDGSSLGLTPFNDLSPYGINFYSGDTYTVTIVYDGSLLTMVILDTTTNAQARFAWPLNLANTTNAAGNYVGFTAGTASAGLFELINWSYYSGYAARVTTPTFSPAPGSYSGAQTVSISYPSGSTCYYTTNGLLPTSSSTKYSGAITVSANEIIQAVAIQAGYTDSLVATGVYQINTSNVINFPNGFSAGSLLPVGYAYLSGSSYRVSDTLGQNTTGAVWFPALVSVSTFSTSFALQWNSGAMANGMCFVIQNNPPPYTSSTGNAINWSGGPTAVAASASALGYGGLNANNSGSNGTSYGLLNSVAIAFDLYHVSNSVGLYTNGASPMGSQVSTGLNFASGHTFIVSLSYTGTTLSFSMTDTVTGAKFSKNFTIDIPTTVGASTAYIGFTGGTGGGTAVQAIQSWTYNASAGQSAAVPAAPTNLRVQ